METIINELEKVRMAEKVHMDLSSWMSIADSTLEFKDGKFLLYDHSEHMRKASEVPEEDVIGAIRTQIGKHFKNQEVITETSDMVMKYFKENKKSH